MHAPGVLTVLALWMLSTACEAATFPTLRAPAAYTARVQREGLTYEAHLRLREGQDYVLHERLTRGPEVRERGSTGIWRQVADGALLQLFNREGQVRRLNVGGEGHMYGHLPSLTSISDGPMVSLTFAPDTPRPRPYVIHGVLHRPRDSAPLLRDVATGHSHALTSDSPALAQLRAGSLSGQAQTYTVKAEVEETTHGLRLLRLYHAAPDAPDTKAMPDSSTALFDDVVPSALWRLWLPALKSLPPLHVQFTPQSPETDESRGVLEMAGNSLYARATYTARGERLELHMDMHETRRLQDAGYGALPPLLQAVQGWDMEGEVLVFSGQGTDLCVLEKYGPPTGRMAVRVVPAAPLPFSPVPPIPQIPPIPLTTGTPLWKEWSH